MLQACPITLFGDPNSSLIRQPYDKSYQRSYLVYEVSQHVEVLKEHFQNGTIISTRIMI